MVFVLLRRLDASVLRLSSCVSAAIAGLRTSALGPLISVSSSGGENSHPWDRTGAIRTTPRNNLHHFNFLYFPCSARYYYIYFLFDCGVRGGGRSEVASLAIWPGEQKTNHGSDPAYSLSGAPAGKIRTNFYTIKP